MPAGVECGSGATRKVRVEGKVVMLLEEYLPVLEVERRGLQKYYRIARNYQGSRKAAVAHLAGKRIVCSFFFFSDHNRDDPS